jgi:hypothetical protein
MTQQVESPVANFARRALMPPQRVQHARKPALGIRNTLTVRLT